MLQNPADLVRARDSSGRDANRAADVLLKYGKGQATSSEVEKQSSGSTSTVGSSK
jgi:pilus assembly protein CpaD